MAEPLWTSEAIAAATGGRLMGRSFQVGGISFDTRSLQPGDLFVALSGERDGHAFAHAAFEAGAAGALTSRPVDGPHIEVGDTLVGLQQLAVAARERSKARRGAVTGSVGKTSVTQAVRAGLLRAGRAHAAVKSFNNHIGVPLTLARMPQDTERAVFEIGMNHAGEIEPLSRLVQPHAVVVTTVGPVHTENFEDGEAGVARAKAEIFAGMAPGATAILPADSAWFELLKRQAEIFGARVLTFGGADGCNAQLLDVRTTGEGTEVRARLHGKTLDFSLVQSGQHWGANSMTVLLMLEALGVPLETGLAALAGFEPLAGRGAEQRIIGPRGQFTLVDESYNANPISMRAAIQTLATRPAAGRRIVALTDMLELGRDAADQHAAVGQALEEGGIDLVFCAGTLMKALWEVLPPSMRAGYGAEAAAVAPEVAAVAGAGDVVMVKGSNGSKASLIAAALRRLDQGGGAA